MRRTKIICTIGPATSSFDMLKALYEAGMNVVRLNMSHGDHETHLKVIKAIKTLNQQIEFPIPILLDTQGPEIRTGHLDSDLQLNEGDSISVSVIADTSEVGSIHIDYQDLIQSVNVGDRITVDNGLINLEVQSKNQFNMQCKVIDGGLLKSKRHVNLPGIRVNLPALTKKDQYDIQFAAENEVDFIALSFVRRAEDIDELRELLGSRASKIKIIAKIEDQEGLANLDAIIEKADAIMVARGDLGVEVPIAQLPNLQRKIVRQCHESGKRVIVATHLLESMIENPIPTRAEATDVANAVYEEVDAIMLSGETTVGKYPIKCIEYLDLIAKESEKLRGLQFSSLLVKDVDKQHLAASAVELAESLKAKG
ncbi:MAG: pyruvate kinase, partial [Gammaproteobacteria bacterium]